MTGMITEEETLSTREYLNRQGLRLSQQEYDLLWQSTLSRLQESFLLKLLCFSTESAPDLEQQAKNLQLPCAEPYYIVSVLEIQKSLSDFVHDPMMLLLGRTLKQTMAAAGFSAFFCADTTGRLCCVVNTGLSQPGEAIEAALTAGLSGLKAFADAHVLFGVGLPVDALAKLCESREDALAALEHSRARLASGDVSGNAMELRYRNRETIQEYLMQCFHNNDLPEIEKAIVSHIEFLRTNIRGKQPLVERFLFAYLQNITRESLRVGVTLERFESYVPSVVNLMQSDIVGTADAVIQLTEQILKYISVHRTSESNHLLNMAKDYIIEHLSDERLDLEAVSNHVGLSRVYFCKLFHQMEGISFNAYLKRERIEKAKKLLVSTNMKVFEISNAVGYSHSKYFGYVFKQTVGLTPLEYQKSIHE